MLDDARLQGELDRWRSAGLLTAEQADAIRAFERGRPAAAAPERRGVTVVEVLAYLGAVVALAGVLILLGTHYAELGGVGRLGVMGLVTAAALGAALLLGTGARGPAALRARAAALALADVGLAALVLQAQVEALGGDLGKLGEHEAARVALVGALVGSAGAAGLLAWTGAGALALLLAVGVYLSGFAFLALESGPQGPWPVETVVVVCGALLVVAAEVGRRLRQRWPPELLGFAALVVPSLAAYTLPRGDQDLGLELLGGLIALAGFGAAVLRSSAGYAIAGAVGIFAFVLEVELRHFQNSLGFALILITSGLALLGVAYLTARLLPRLARG